MEQCPGQVSAFQTGLPLTGTSQLLGKAVQNQADPSGTEALPRVCVVTGGLMRQVGSSAWTGGQEASGHSRDSGLQRPPSRGLTGLPPDVPQPVGGSCTPQEH